LNLIPSDMVNLPEFEPSDSVNLPESESYDGVNLSAPEPSDGGDVHIFTDPLMEKAVRVSLGKAEDEPITRNDLSDVTGLFFVEKKLPQAKTNSGV